MRSRFRFLLCSVFFALAINLFGFTELSYAVLCLLAIYDIYLLLQLRRQNGR